MIYIYIIICQSVSPLFGFLQTRSAGLAAAEPTGSYFFGKAASISAADCAYSLFSVFNIHFDGLKWLAGFFLTGFADAALLCCRGSTSTISAIINIVAIGSVRRNQQLCIGSCVLIRISWRMSLLRYLHCLSL